MLSACSRSSGMTRLRSGNWNKLEKYTMEQEALSRNYVETYAKFEERYEGILGEASQSEETITLNKAYYSALGHQKRGGVFGVRSTSDVYYKKLRTRTPLHVAYAPSIIAQFNSRWKRLYTDTSRARRKVSRDGGNREATVGNSE